MGGGRSRGTPEIRRHCPWHCRWYHWQCRPQCHTNLGPGRAGARLLGAAAPPEGRRDRPGAEPARRAARADVRATPSRFATEIGYRNAGTVEFLLDPRRQLRLHRDEPAHPGRAHRDRGGHRRRPRAVADPDRRRRDARPTSACSQDTVQLRGAALQCRITTEDPANGFRPDTGKITTYRSPGGAGRPPRRRHDVHRRRGQRALRLDAGQAHLPRPRPSRRPSTGPGARSRSSGSAASPPTSRSSRPSSTTRTSPAGRRHHRVHRRRTRSC